VPTADSGLGWMFEPPGSSGVGIRIRNVVRGWRGWGPPVEGEEAVLHVMGWGCGRHGCDGTRTRAATLVWALWEHGELTPEEIAEHDDFFRVSIEKVVVSPARQRGRPRKYTPSDVPDGVRIVWR
jgi:hypothetical protein